ncbi:predicted protein [Naegleria gruberi]|uniref:Predicted protein n=1 Tax=Naegleria gruberi TaxID=5762 RepID=D2VFH5_NAEGR|nr:uncharacterized protein NAEGRDRAFT_67629 [Naegleria gruberi]EFC44466.1 predicted protein [Naegleria gruberi]|eukprot:XP_002677210.1 predicted protein [Naegleria gruberi strain NEG-M]
MSSKSCSVVSTICCLAAIVLLIGVAIAFGLYVKFYTSSQLKIESFSPSSGSVNSTVVIYGSGFNSTQTTYNIVKFNGVSATVSSANSTVLLVKVPPLATSGTISVKVSQTTFESVDTFTVVTTSSNTTNSTSSS